MNKKKSYSLKTLDERIKECVKDKGKILDLSRLKLNSIDTQIIPKNIEMLFLSHNYLRELPSLSDFKKLKIIDVSFNKLRNIHNLSPNIEELCCSNNLLKNLNTDYLLKLKRLNCSFNFLEELEFKGTILDCSSNKLKKIEYTHNLKKLYCSKNSLRKIKYSRNLENIICSENLITDIPVGDKIHNLICDHNNITNLPTLPELNFLHCNNNKINKISFYPKLIELVCDPKIHISKKYKITEKITIDHPDSECVKLRFKYSLKN